MLVVVVLRSLVPDRFTYHAQVLARQQPVVALPVAVAVVSMLSAHLRVQRLQLTLTLLPDAMPLQTMLLPLVVVLLLLLLLAAMKLATCRWVPQLPEMAMAMALGLGLGLGLGLRTLM